MPTTKKWSTLRDDLISKPGAAERLAAAEARVDEERKEYTLGELRRSLGITQAQLAEMIGRSQSAVSQMENGQFALTVDMLRAIIEQMGGKLLIRAVFDPLIVTTIDV